MSGVQESIGASRPDVERFGPGSGKAGRRQLVGFERILAMLGFPLLISASIGLAVVAIGRGGEPNAVTGGMIFVAYVLIAVSERLWPWHRSWLHSQGDLRTDIGLAITNGMLGGVLTPLLLAAVALAGASIAERFGFALWPNQWPLLLQHSTLQATLLAMAIENLLPSNILLHAMKGLLRIAVMPPAAAPSRCAFSISRQSMRLIRSPTLVPRLSSSPISER